jgi:hypothetical protein
LTDEELDHANTIQQGKAPTIGVHTDNGRAPTIVIRESQSVNTLRKTIVTISPKRGRYSHLYPAYKPTVDAYLARRQHKQERSRTVGGNTQADNPNDARIGNVDAGKNDKWQIGYSVDARYIQ